MTTCTQVKQLHANMTKGRNANDKETFVALNLQPALQNQMNFKIFSDSDCVNGRIWCFGVKMEFFS